MTRHAALHGDAAAIVKRPRKTSWLVTCSDMVLSLLSADDSYLVYLALLRKSGVTAVPSQHAPGAPILGNHALIGASEIHHQTLVLLILILPLA